MKGEKYTVDTLADQITQTFKQSSNPTSLLGFVTAAHYADSIPAILQAIKQSSNQAITPTVVYNSSGYESVDTLRTLEGIVDIYLPDFKYMDSALEEMIRQVGIGLKMDENGIAYRGLIVRHLVLPGHIDNSIAVLNKLSTLNSQLSTLHSLHLSLMAQYFPPRPGLPAPLDRCITEEEYATVVAHAEEMGLTDGWIQELEARDNYRPNFTNENPFEK